MNAGSEVAKSFLVSVEQVEGLMPSRENEENMRC